MKHNLTILIIDEELTTGAAREIVGDHLLSALAELEGLSDEGLDWRTLDLRIHRGIHTDPETGMLDRDDRLTLRLSALDRVETP